MNIKIKIVLLIASLSILISSVCYTLWWCNNSEKVLYSGVILFDTEQEYLDFKDTLLSEDVSIVSVNVLDNNSPIWVEYKIITPRNMEFSYYFKHKDAKGEWYYTFIPAIIGAISTLATLLLLTTKKKGE